MKINFFKKEKNIKKENLRFDISLYWKISVFIMLFVIPWVMFFGYSFFMKINKEPVLEVDGTSGQIEKIRKDRINKVLEYFSLKNQKSEQILTTPSSIVDPSI